MLNWIGIRSLSATGGVNLKRNCYIIQWLLMALAISLASRTFFYCFSAKTQEKAA